jgi:hypothetical protein
MGHDLFVWTTSTSKGQKLTKIPISPEKYGAVKSEVRNYQNPLWLAFEPPRGFEP